MEHLQWPDVSLSPIIPQSCLVLTVFQEGFFIPILQMKNLKSEKLVPFKAIKYPNMGTVLTPSSGACLPHNVAPRLSTKGGWRTRSCHSSWPPAPVSKPAGPCPLTPPHCILPDPAFQLPAQELDSYGRCWARNSSL